jgi:hypothetical protein
MQRDFDRDEFLKMPDIAATTSVYNVILEPTHIVILRREVEGQIQMHEFNLEKGILTEEKKDDLIINYSIRERLKPLIDDQDVGMDIPRPLGLATFEMICTNNLLLTKASLMKNPDVNQFFLDGLGGKVYAEIMGLFISLNRGFVLAGGPMLPHYNSFLVENRNMNLDKEL